MLGDDIAAALPELREQAKSRMTETVQVGVFEDGTDPVTLDPTRVLVTERYSGIGRVRLGSRNITNANGPAMPVAVQEPYLSVPVVSPRLLKGDEVLVTASTSDGLLVGMRMRVAGSPALGQVTAHRYPLEEAT